ncbi:MAG: hypothetical protein GXO20_05405 [Thermodesulfobacteria bacterium]|nr:hypothetical protein [Thermodesulfobacteriota bacterium]
MKPDLSREEARKLLEEKVRTNRIRLVLDTFWPRLERYLSAFEKEAPRLNLTAVKSRRELLLGPVFDSLFLAAHLPAGAKCADLGTGAGIPGFIVKLARPDLTMYLLEAYAPRVDFMKRLIRELGEDGLEAHRCHLGFEDCAVEAPVALSRGYGAVEKFVSHAARFMKAEEAFYLWRKDVEPWREKDLPLRLVRRIPLPGRPLELLCWQKV